MLLAILAKILIVLGAVALAALVLKVLFLTLRSVLQKVRDRLRVSVGRKCFVGAVSRLAREVTLEAERNGNIHSVDEMLAELGEEGVVIADMDANGHVDRDKIEIISSREIDEKLENLLDQNQGEIVFA